MEPELVYLIVCDRFQLDPRNLYRINLHGLMARLSSISSSPFPMICREFCVFAMFTGGQGPVDIMIRVVSDVAGRTIFRTVPRRFRFMGGPNDLSAAAFKLRGCTFPAPGLYWIECLADQTVIGRQRLWVSPQRTVP